MKLITTSIENEYLKLCKLLSLMPKQLDIYEWDENSDQFTAHGTSKRNATPAYTKKVIILPQILNNNLSNSKYPFQSNTTNPLEFPPIIFDAFNNDMWPMWRTELWHEVCHQIEDEILNLWKPGDDNPETFNTAIEYLSDRLKVSANSVKRVL